MAPMIDPEATGVVASNEQYPWVKKDNIIGLPVAVVQAWGYVGVRPEDKFQVCLLLTPLTDMCLADGEDTPLLFCVSFDAEQQDNPRRAFLAHFSDPKSDPIGPMAMEQVPAQNQQGWVWALRKCPTPVELVDDSRIVRELYRQNWRQHAVTNYRQRQAAIAAAAEAKRTAELAAQNTNGHQLAAGGGLPVNDLPF